MNRTNVPPVNPGLLVAFEVPGGFFTRQAPTPAAKKKAAQAGSPQVFWDPNETIYPNRGLIQAFNTILLIVPPEGIGLYSNAVVWPRIVNGAYMRPDDQIVETLFQRVLNEEAQRIRGMKDLLKRPNLRNALMVWRGSVFQNTPVRIHIPGNEGVLSLPAGRDAEVATFNAWTELPVFPAGRGSADANYYLAPVRAALPDYKARLTAWKQHLAAKAAAQPA